MYAADKGKVKDGNELNEARRRKGRVSRGKGGIERLTTAEKGDDLGEKKLESLLSYPRRGLERCMPREVRGREGERWKGFRERAHRNPSLLPPSPSLPTASLQIYAETKVSTVHKMLLI